MTKDERELLESMADSCIETKRMRNCNMDVDCDKCKYQMSKYTDVATGSLIMNRRERIVKTTQERMVETKKKPMTEREEFLLYQMASSCLEVKTRGSCDGVCEKCTYNLSKYTDKVNANLVMNLVERRHVEKQAKIDSENVPFSVTLYGYAYVIGICVAVFAGAWVLGKILEAIF